MDSGESNLNKNYTSIRELSATQFVGTNVEVDGARNDDEGA